jgi:glucans biosynthesis protein C
MGTSLRDVRPPTGDARYHALDSLRATMMLLGIYLHVVVGYSGDGNWPYIDPHPTGVLNFTLGIIHSFRMPAFYVMAGFFGALLWNRRGPASFVSNRVHRIALPFALFWIWMFPLTSAIVVGLQRGTHAIVPFFTSGMFLTKLHPMHMWFLEYLILLYALGALVAFVARSWPRGVHNRIHAAFRWALLRPYAPVLAALLSWLPLTAMRGNLRDVSGLMPDPVILVAYIVPFTFGWLLYHSRDLLPRFERSIWVYIGLGVPAFLVYGLVPGAAHPFVKAAGNVLLCWFLTFATIGLFLRHASAESPRWRYMSDSSYWLYLMHLPVVVLLQVAMLPVPLPALAKVPLVLALAVGLLVISYDLFVRPTWIGQLLNGRRYPRGVPEPKAALRGAGGDVMAPLPTGAP